MFFNQMEEMETRSCSVYEDWIFSSYSCLFVRGVS